MSTSLKSLWSRLFGGEGADRAENTVTAEPTEYKGYLITPAPYPAKGQFQTAGVIEKEFETGWKEHRFVRAETHPSMEDAVSFTIAKGKQIIDEQGDRLFG